MKLALLALLAACSGPPRATPQRPERITSTGDVTLRERPSGGVVVLVVRSEGDVRAAGDATVLIGDAAHTPHVRLAGARAWLAVAQSAHAADAYAAAKSGLAELGRDYAPRGAIDDTDNLVKIAAAAAEPAKAAETARKALADRIAMYLRRYQGEVE